MDPCLLTRLASSEVMTVFGSCTCKDTKSWNSNGFLVHSKNSSVTCTWVDEYVSASVLACTNSADFGRCAHMVIKQTHPKIHTKRKQTSKQLTKDHATADRTCGTWCTKEYSKFGVDVVSSTVLVVNNSPKNSYCIHVSVRACVSIDSAKILEMKLIVPQHGGCSGRASASVLGVTWI